MFVINIFVSHAGGSWNNLGSNYGSSYSGGPQRNTGSYQSKGSGPYGGELLWVIYAISSNSSCG